MKLSAIDWNKVFEFTWRILVFIVAVAIIVIVSTNWNRWEGGVGWQSTNDAYTQSDLTPINSKVTGYIRALPIYDYERVHKGQVLAQLVDDDYRATVTQAIASIALATAEGETLRAQRELQLANIQAARAVVASTSAQLEQNGRDRARQLRELRTGSSTVEEREKLDTTHAQLDAQLMANRAQASAAEREIPVLDGQLAQNAAALAAARAALVTARLNLEYTTIIAPQDGQIGQRQVKPGQLVGVGTQITTLTPLPQVWVIANFKETQVTHMAVGQNADIYVDSFPGHTFHGHLLAFSPGSGAEFALLPPDNATGNFTKVVQRIPIKISIDDADGYDYRLVPGMSVEAWIDATDHHR
jgi:membrane fusion protein, multidrug efflux system